MRANNRLDMTLSEQARELARQAGLTLPARPSERNEPVRREIAAALGIRVEHVTSALRARNPNATPEQRVKRAESQLKRLEQRVAKSSSKPLEVFSKRQRQHVEDELRRAEAAKAEAEKRLNRALSEAEDAHKRAAEIEQRAKARLAAAREKERAGMPKRRAYGSVKYKFKSQKMPQISVIRFGKDLAWVVDAIAQYQASMVADTGIHVSTSQVAKFMIGEVVGALWSRKAEITSSRQSGIVAKIGPIRLPEKDQHLIKELESLAEANGVGTVDVARWALAKWLTDKGFGKRKGK